MANLLEQKNNDFNIHGPQFDPGAGKTKIITIDLGGTGANRTHPLADEHYTTIYTVPAGRTLFISEMTQTEKTGGASVSYVKIKDILVWIVNVTTQASFQMSLGSPFILKAGETIKAGHLTDATVIAHAFIGWET